MRKDKGCGVTFLDCKDYTEKFLNTLKFLNF